MKDLSSALAGAILISLIAGCASSPSSKDSVRATPPWDDTKSVALNIAIAGGVVTNPARSILRDAPNPNGGRLGSSGGSSGVADVGFAVANVASDAVGIGTAAAGAFSALSLLDTPKPQKEASPLLMVWVPDHGQTEEILTAEVMETLDKALFSTYLAGYELHTRTWNPTLAPWIEETATYLIGPDCTGAGEGMYSQCNAWTWMDYKGRVTPPAVLGMTGDAHLLVGGATSLRNGMAPTKDEWRTISSALPSNYFYYLPPGENSYYKGKPVMLNRGQALKFVTPQPSDRGAGG